LIGNVPGRSACGRVHRARVAVLATVAATASAFAGCGGGSDGTGTNSTTTSAQALGGTGSQRTTPPQVRGVHRLEHRLNRKSKGGTISEAVDAVFESGDPDKACASRYVTEHYLSAAYGGRSGCVQAQARGTAARYVHLAAEAQSGTKVIVKAVPHGGLYDGERLTVTLVKEGDAWKIDSLKSNEPVGP
jgi:hypothetical protein